MRVIVRKERPHPGAQLRFTDIDGHRFTCFATSTRTGQLADLELRHRRRARCEDRIRNAKDTGLRNLPLHGYHQNQIWCEIVALACELLAWIQMLALTGPGPPVGTKRLRLRLFSAAGRIVRGGRRLRLRLAARWPWAPDRRRHRPPAGPRARLTSRNIPATRKENTAGPWNPAHPARQPGRQPRPAPKTANQPQPQATNPRSRKIEASPAHMASHGTRFYDLRHFYVSADRGEPQSEGHSGAARRTPRSARRWTPTDTFSGRR